MTYPLLLAVLTLAVLTPPVPRTGRSVAEGAPVLCSTAQTLGEADLEAICGDVSYLGHGTFHQLGVLETGQGVRDAVFAPEVGELEAQRHLFLYEGVGLSVEDTTAQSLEHVLRTSLVLRRLATEVPRAYGVIAGTRSFWAARSPRLWKNRFAHYVVSFDRTPEDIAAGVSMMDRSPTRDDSGVSLYDNVALVSIDSETILGGDPDAGSRPIYRLADDRANYLRYMEDGLAYSLVHEGLHRYADHFNSVDDFAAAVRGGRGQAYHKDAEEYIVNHSALALLRGAISADQVGHVDDLQRDYRRDREVMKRVQALCRSPVSAAALLEC